MTLATFAGRCAEARRRKRARGEGGYSAIELVLYTPLIMSLSMMAIQFSLVYLGNQVASGTAREVNRVARVSGKDDALDKGADLIAQSGSGVLNGSKIKVTRDGDFMETTVTGHAMQVLPFLPPPTVSEKVRGPIERFEVDQ